MKILSLVTLIALSQTLFGMPEAADRPTYLEVLPRDALALVLAPYLLEGKNSDEVLQNMHNS